ncbi:MAG: hypothetical protein LBV46_02970 [Bacteroidales bacterium]|jgi:hypothetical protein|nr:hypothetical protein [Bacteroidales bacterium]
MNKKHAILTIIAISLLSLFIFSCEKKDGVYRPDKKIDKIYIQQEDKDSTLYAQWTWDKSLLQTIYYPLTQETYSFSYEHKRLTKIEIDDNKKMLKLNYQYDEKTKKINKINIYQHDTLLCDMQYFYKTVPGKTAFSKDITRIVSVMIREYNDISHKSLMNQLLPLPEEVWEAMDALQNISGTSSKSKGVANTYTLTFSWNGDNVDQIKAEYQSIIATIKYLYDDNKNPFQNMFNGATEFDVIEGFGVATCNVNNVLSASMYIGEGIGTLHSETKNQYTYSKKYPTKIISAKEFMDSSTWNKKNNYWYIYK